MNMLVGMSDRCSSLSDEWLTEFPNSLTVMVAGKRRSQDVNTASPLTYAPFPKPQVTVLCENSWSPGETAGMGSDLLKALGKLRLEIKNQSRPRSQHEKTKE